MEGPVSLDLCAQDGTKLTASMILERLEREAASNVGLEIASSPPQQGMSDAAEVHTVPWYLALKVTVRIGARSRQFLTPQRSRLVNGDALPGMPSLETPTHSSCPTAANHGSTPFTLLMLLLLSGPSSG